MRMLDEKNAFVLLCFLCLWLSVAFFHFVHVPLQEEKAAILEDAEQISMEIIEIENFMNKHTNLKEYAADLSKQMEKADHALPDSMAQSSIISLFQHHALDQQIQLASITPGQAKREHDLLMLPINIKLKCNYFQLLDFLKAIQEDGRFLKINQVVVHTTDDKLSFEIEAIAYAMEAPQGTGMEPALP